MYKAGGEYSINQPDNVEHFDGADEYHARNNDSWLGYGGDKRNYLRGGTFVNGGLIGEGGDMANAVQIEKTGTVTAKGGVLSTVNDSWLGYPDNKYNYLRGGTVVRGGFIGEGGDMKNAMMIGTDGSIVVNGVSLSGEDITNLKALLG